VKDRLIFVEVGDEREEADTLSRRHSLAAVLGGEVVPVLNERGLLQRLTEVLVRHNVPISVLKYEHVHRLNGRRGRGAREGTPSSSGPGAVIAVDEVDESVTRLAASLCNAEVIRIRSGSPWKLKDPSPGGDGSVLILLNPDATPAQTVIGILGELSSAGRGFGCVLVLDSVEARFAVLKSLMVSRITVRPESVAVISGRYAPASAQGAPDVVCSREIRDADASAERRGMPAKPREQRVREADFLILNGHASAFDSGVGRDFVLCARLGATAGGRRVFPCFHDGACFRQGDRDYPPNDPRGLVGLAEADAPVVVISGCNVFAAGRSWFDAGRSMAYQGTQTSSLALIVSAGFSVSSLELDFLNMALAAEGLALGEVIREVNRTRWETLEHATGLPPRLGPLILIGNPSATITGIVLQSPPVEWVDRGCVRFKLSEVEVAPASGALIRIRIPPRDGRPYILASRIPEGLWCRGVYFAGNSAPVLYLWVGSGSHPSEPGDRIVLHLVDEDPWREAASRFAHALGELGFWFFHLSTIRRKLEERGVKTEAMDEALRALPLVRRFLARAIVLLRVKRGVVVVDQKALDSLVRDAAGHVARLSSALLRCSLEYTYAFGCFHFLAWQADYVRLKAEGPLGRCRCGEAELYADKYVSPDGPGHERMVYYCAACGLVGEDDGRRLISAVAVSGQVRRGEKLVWECECRAPAVESVEFHLAGLIECYWRKRRLAGEPRTTTVHPGERTTVTLEIPVPEDLEQGMYAAVVLGVANGALCIRRRMVEIV